MASAKPIFLHGNRRKGISPSRLLLLGTLQPKQTLAAPLLSLSRLNTAATTASFSSFPATTKDAGDLPRLPQSLPRSLLPAVSSSPRLLYIGGHIRLLPLHSSSKTGKYSSLYRCCLSLGLLVVFPFLFLDCQATWWLPADLHLSRRSFSFLPATQPVSPPFSGGYPVPLLPQFV